MTNFVSYGDATTLFTEVGNKLRALSGAYVVKGNVAFVNLPSPLTAAMNGYVYNITDAFTTTADFVEGAGKAYPANTNVVIVNLGTSDVPNMKFDVLGSFVDVSGIDNKINAVSAMITDIEFSDATAYSEGDIVKKENVLYKFNTDHAAGDWDATEVDAVTVLELIEAAEPNSLTTAQINALLALLD